LIQVERLTLNKCRFNQWLMRRQCCKSRYMIIQETWI